MSRDKVAQICLKQTFPIFIFKFFHLALITELLHQTHFVSPHLIKLDYCIVL